MDKFEEIHASKRKVGYALSPYIFSARMNVKHCIPKATAKRLNNDRARLIMARYTRRVTISSALCRQAQAVATSTDDICNLLTSCDCLKHPQQCETTSELKFLHLFPHITTLNQKRKQRHKQQPVRN